MDAEILTIGDELLSGHTTNTNAVFIARQLTAVGINVKYQSSIGDSLDEIEKGIRLALSRTSLVITTGGLGPTDDDITKKGIVKVFRRNLIFHEDVLEELKDRFVKRGMVMPAIVQNQALLPQGASFFPNKNGSAVGICITEKGKIFIALPGVPKEMIQILTDEVLPYLRGLKTNLSTFVTTLHTVNISEATIAELIKPNLKIPQGTKLAYLPGYDGVDLRIISRANSPDEAEQKVNRLVTHINSVCSKYIYGQDDENLEGVIGQLLIDNDKTLAVAESCTGGELGKVLTSAPGASKYFIGGVISYSNDIKMDLLKVPEEILKEHGAVSEECAIAMAEGARKLLNSSYAISITGIAGPDGATEEKSVGTTYIGLSSAHNKFAKKFIFGTDRDVNRTRASYTALELLRREILDL